MPNEPKGLTESFWDDDPDGDVLPRTSSTQEAHKASAEDACAELFADLSDHLEAYFPAGLPEVQKKPATTARRVGDHWVGFVGSYKPGDSELIINGYWRQDVAVLQNSRGGRGSANRGASIEKAVKTITTAKQAAIWLLWVHRNICKVSGEAIRNATHPDNFLKDTSVAFRAVYDCHMIGADFDDLEDLIVQRLPWTTKVQKRFTATLLRNGSRVGLLGVRYKDQWSYGGSIDIKEVNPLWAMAEPLKFKHKVPEARCKTEEDAIKRAERLYAKKVFEWMLDHCTNEGLRRRR